MEYQLTKAFSIVTPMLWVVIGIATVLIEPYSTHCAISAFINTLFLDIAY